MVVVRDWRAAAVLLALGPVLVGGEAPQSGGAQDAMSALSGTVFYRERMRLLAFEKVELAPGESKTVSLTGDPRLLGRYDESAGQWRLAEGDYEVMVGKSAGQPVLTGRARVSGKLLGK
jgi:hypothetical protein